MLYIVNSDMTKSVEILDSLTFDDVLLVPQYSEICPFDVDLKTTLTPQIPLNIPILSAAMDKVTESKTAVTMARLGGIGIIHRNLRAEEQALEVEKVKKSESGMIANPVTLKPHQTVFEALNLMKKFGISGLPIVEDDGRLMGIATNRDLRFEESPQRKIKEVMTPFEKLITSGPEIIMEDAVRLMHTHRVEKLPIVGPHHELLGLITIKDIEKSISHPLANKDAKGRLRVGAAIGTGTESQNRLKLLDEVGVDVVVIDTAHGDSKSVIEMVKWAKKNFKSLNIIAGNIATPEGASHLFEAGADAVKVGMGCGSICTTRMISGVGVAQFSAVMKCAPIARKFGKTLIADGGIKYSGDIVKALAAGADSVMMGSLLAGTDEAPGEFVLYQGRSYKIYRGMGSLDAMKSGSRDRYGQADTAEEELIPEGIEGMVSYRGALSQVIHQFLGGVKAGMGYLGSKNVQVLREKAQFVKISSQGLRESHVHDVYITKEAPNYRPLQ